MDWVRVALFKDVALRGWGGGVVRFVVVFVVVLIGELFVSCWPLCFLMDVCVEDRRVDC